MASSNFKQVLNRVKLKCLASISPRLAGQFATKLFVTSRNDANPHRKAFTPIGAKAIPVTQANSAVKNIYVWGDQGEIVLLVHGWGAECGSMFGFASTLVKQGFRVATFDGPAHGSSKGEFSTMSAYVRETKTVIKQLSELGSVTRVVAHSLGGIVALAATAHNPDIKKIALVSTPKSLSDVLDIWSGSFAKLKKTVKTEIRKQLLIDNGVPVSHWDVGLHGNGSDADILILHSSDDPIVPASHAETIESILPTGKLEVLSGLGHIRILSNPKTLNHVSSFFVVEPSTH